MLHAVHPDIPTLVHLQILNIPVSAYSCFQFTYFPVGSLKIKQLLVGQVLVLFLYHKGLIGVEIGIKPINLTYLNQILQICFFVNFKIIIQIQAENWATHQNQKDHNNDLHIRLILNYFVYVGFGNFGYVGFLDNLFVPTHFLFNIQICLFFFEKVLKSTIDSCGNIVVTVYLLRISLFLLLIHLQPLLNYLLNFLFL